MLLHRASEAVSQQYSLGLPVSMFLRRGSLCLATAVATFQAAQHRPQAGNTPLRGVGMASLCEAVNPAGDRVPCGPSVCGGFRRGPCPKAEDQWSSSRIPCVPRLLPVENSRAYVDHDW